MAFKKFRDVYVVSGGISKFAKARPDVTFQPMVKEAYDYALNDIGMENKQAQEVFDGSVSSYFSDHFARQLMAGIMLQDYLGLCPLPSHRVEAGGATGGVCFQEAYKNIASGVMVSAWLSASRRCHTSIPGKAMNLSRWLRMSALTIRSAVSIPAIMP